MFLKTKTDNLLYKFVLFYQDFPLRFKSQRRHRTLIGLIFTFIIILLFLLFLILSLIQLFGRKNLNIIESKDIKPDISLTLDDIPFYFAVFNSYDQIIDSSIINVSMLYLTYDIENEYFNTEIINLKQCTLNNSLSKDIENDYPILNAISYLCPQKTSLNYNLKGKILENSYASFYLIIEKCNSSISANCKSESEINSVLSNANFLLLYPEAFVDHYNQNNPLRKKLRFKMLTINLSLHKIYTLLLSSIKYASDNGIFTQSFNNYSYFYTEEIQFELYDDSDYVFALTFSVGQIQYEYIRSYDKFTTILSNLFSLISTLNILFNVILSYFLRRMLLIDTINEIFFNKEKTNEGLFKLMKNSEKKKKISNDEIQLEDINFELKKKKNDLEISNHPTNDNNEENKEIIKKKMKNKNNENENEMINDKSLFNINYIKLKFYQFFLTPICFQKNKNKKIIDICKKHLYEEISIEKIFMINNSMNKLNDN